MNEQQRKIIESNEKHILVLAGAGSGKTYTLIQKIKKIKSTKLDAKILCLTFSNLAAKELKNRLRDETVDVFTCHGFCFKLIQSYISNKQVLFETPRQFTKQEILKISVERAKGAKKQSLLLKKYLDFLNKNSLFDFDDMLLLCLNKLINLEIKVEYDYILIDEVQDTNSVQFTILSYLIGKNTKTILVGDIDQGIYKFRGASFDLIEKYRERYRPKVLMLTQNYRSAKTIVNCANRLIEKNQKRPEKTLFSDLKLSADIKIYLFSTILDFVKMLKNYLVVSSKKNENIQEICVLVRRNQERVLLENRLTNGFSLFEYVPKVYTVHESKGLEFKTVFIVGLNEGVFPDTKSGNLLDLEEERRLMYVAITRAKQNLYLVSFDFSLDGTKLKPSRFLKEIQ